jgi:hypothetical protein
MYICDLSKCEELNPEVYTFHKHTNWNYGKTANNLGFQTHK